ncbi:MAG TPA: HAD family hydrolase [Candidatus Polarisedimenticolia bacterium]|nr:HAD family hydrolase [Candidatus Polarisedimenticolia bacterium]
MSLSWIFFDAGNTLIGLDYSRLVRALAAGGFHLDELQLRRAELSARRDLDRAILQRWSDRTVPRTGWIEAKVWGDFWRRVVEIAGADSYRAADLAREVLKVTRPASSWDRVESTTPAALDRLIAMGYRLGVISNSSGTLVEHMTRIGLASRFEVIVDSAEVGVEKPHPEIFGIALERAGLPEPSRALYVGDIYAIDVLGAAGAGMHAMLFDPLGQWEPESLPEGAPACRALKSLAELPELLA